MLINIRAYLKHYNGRQLRTQMINQLPLVAEFALPLSAQRLERTLVKAIGIAREWPLVMLQKKMRRSELRYAKEAREKIPAFIRQQQKSGASISSAYVIIRSHYGQMELCVAEQVPHFNVLVTDIATHKHLSNDIPA